LAASVPVGFRHPVIGAFIVMRYTTYGRAMYAIGGNAEASHLAALPVKRYQLIAFTLSGLSAAVAGVFLTSQLAAGAPQAAFGLELSVIAAVVLGGTSLAGGKGNLLGTLVGVLIWDAQQCILCSVSLLTTEYRRVGSPGITSGWAVSAGCKSKQEVRSTE
jgi:ribose/xylose/arabinose/galactoside ABC-type transport system permease subunit